MLRKSHIRTEAIFYDRHERSDVYASQTKLPQQSTLKNTSSIYIHF
jgi:hypothetical protein